MTKAFNEHHVRDSTGEESASKQPKKSFHVKMSNISVSFPKQKHSILLRGDFDHNLLPVLLALSLAFLILGPIRRSSDFVTFLILRHGIAYPPLYVPNISPQ